MGEKVTAGELRPNQRKALEALLATGSITQAATAAGVARKTVYNWLKEPNFGIALKAAEVEALDNLARSLISLAPAAVEALARVLDDPAATHTQRIRAAEAILSNTLRLRELHSIEARLTALEQRV